MLIASNMFHKYKDAMMSILNTSLGKDNFTQIIDEAITEKLRYLNSEIPLSGISNLHNLLLVGELAKINISPQTNIIFWNRKGRQATLLLFISAIFYTNVNKIKNLFTEGVAL